jgi:hypothetical protein
MESAVAHWHPGARCRLVFSCQPCDRSVRLGAATSPVAEDRHPLARWSRGHLVRSGLFTALALAELPVNLIR